MSSSLTRLFKKKEAQAASRNGAEGGLDEYADPWDMRNSANTNSPVGPSGGHNSYSSPFSSGSRPSSPKPTDAMLMKKGGPCPNDDYQDPADARTRVASTSRGDHGHRGMSQSHPQHASSSRGDYNTPADVLKGRTTSSDALSTYCLPADTIRGHQPQHPQHVSMSQAHAQPSSANSQYSTPRDTIRSSHGDVGIQQPMHADYSTPVDHLSSDVIRGSPSRGRYQEFRGPDGSGTPNDSTSNQLIMSRQPESRGALDFVDPHSQAIRPGAPVQSSQASQREALAQCKWFHGMITRDHAEMLLRSVPDCSFLVRISESSPNDYSLSVRNSGQPLHLKINRRPDGNFVLGQNSKPFQSIIDMVQYYERHRLLIKGAEHIFLEYVIARHT